MLLLSAVASLPAGEPAGRAFTGPLPAKDDYPAIPAGVIGFRDVPYVTNGHPRQKLDLYLPAGAEQRLPVVVYVHGGAWREGSKNGGGPLRGGLVGKGYAVASINYRLSGHAVFPAQLEDCKAAVRWLRANADRFHLDPERIAVWGHSAGGHLAALLGTTGGTREFDVGEKLEYPSRVSAVIDYYGPTDFAQMDAHASGEAAMRHDPADSPESQLIGGPIQAAANRERVRRANPIAYVGPATAPFLVVHGDEDPVVPHHQSELLYAALVAQRVSVHFVTVKGGGHGGGFPAEQLSPLIEDFLERHLKGPVSSGNAPVAKRSEVAAIPKRSDR